MEHIQYYKRWIENPSKPAEIRIDIENQVYHEDLGSISASWLKEGHKSMHRFLTYPFKPKSEGSPSLRLGTLVHTMILEPSLFKDKYFVLNRSELPFPESTMAKKENKEFVESKKALGFEVLDYDVYEQVKSMAESVLSDPLMRKYMAAGYIENSIYWSDPDTGLPMRTRPDLWVPLANNKAAIVDIKTTDSAYATDFFSSVAKFYYPLQAAIQCDGVAIATGREISTYLYVAVEKNYPYDYCIYRLVEDDIAASRVMYKEILSQIKVCVETDVWPSYGRSRIDRKMLDDNNLDIIDVVLPAYYYGK